MFDVTLSSGRPGSDGLPTAAESGEPTVVAAAAEPFDPWDDDALMAEPDGDVFGWDDEDEDDDDYDDDDPDLADDFDDDED